MPAISASAPSVSTGSTTTHLQTLPPAPPQLVAAWQDNPGQQGFTTRLLAKHPVPPEPRHWPG